MASDEAPAPPLGTDLEQQLVALALEARTQAYAPYSHFQVGAALLAESGKIYMGCNVENASYGLCLCAERNAIAAAIAAGERRFRAIAVVGGCHVPASPCGACRQVMVEFSPAMEVIMAPAESPERVERTTAAALLPNYFSFGTNS
ncbi:MAG: cytidine deaminase [Candidatus Sumerlaeaceae bacterium]|nr:cytidine deaminase [Candidatus Sumerlaeaceae bacterium]